jgi:Domain of unknown function (DUF4382)/Carboxypeptidase regulatory-like domain
MKFKVASILTTFSIIGLLGCGGSSGSGNAPTQSAINVSLVDGPTSAYRSLFVNIQSIQISKDGASWTTLSTLNGPPIDLLTLTGGVSESLAKGVTLDAGTYGQIRLLLGSTGNTVVLNDGTSHDLTIPSGTQTGIKLVGPFVVQPGTTADVWIDFDAAHSIQLVGAGASGKYMLRPTVFAYEKAVTGSISGTLTDANGAVALPNVPVLAEVMDSSGNPSVVRSTATDATGKYTLDLLPVGGTYYVVSLPITAAGKVYAPQASDGFSLTSASPTFTFSAAFTASTTLGSLSGTLTPLATTDQSDSVQLMTNLNSTPSGTSHSFVVDSVMAAVGSASETFDFGNLPVGTYSLVGQRTTQQTDGSSTRTTSVAVPVSLTQDTVTTAAIGF